MLGILKIKSLVFGLLLASPALGFWVFQGLGASFQQTSGHRMPSAEMVPAPEKITRIPVEVIAKGSAPEWVYVSVEGQAVPEPGTALLFILSGVWFALRRQRH